MFILKSIQNFLLIASYEEHGIIKTVKDNDIKITEKITIIPNHACTVINLFDHYLIQRKDEIINKCEVDARGKVK